jgi:hypothetical protein
LVDDTLDFAKPNLLWPPWKDREAWQRAESEYHRARGHHHHALSALIRMGTRRAYEVMVEHHAWNGLYANPALAAEIVVRTQFQPPSFHGASVLGASKDLSYLPLLRRAQEQSEAWAQYPVAEARHQLGDSDALTVIKQISAEPSYPWHRQAAGYLRRLNPHNNSEPT